VRARAEDKFWAGSASTQRYLDLQVNRTSTGLVPRTQLSAGFAGLMSLLEQDLDTMLLGSAPFDSIT
jgi:hypothetical protein